MEDSQPNFRLDYSLINWLDYRKDRINPPEVDSAYEEPGREFRSTKDPATGEWFYYFIGFSSKKRFLVVLLTPHEDDVERLIVYKILIADEQKIRKLYYGPKFRKS
jgi:hypothetical protein